MPGYISLQCLSLVSESLMVKSLAWSSFSPYTNHATCSLTAPLWSWVEEGWKKITRDVLIWFREAGGASSPKPENWVWNPVMEVPKTGIKVWVTKPRVRAEKWDQNTAAESNLGSGMPEQLLPTQNGTWYLSLLASRSSEVLFIAMVKELELGGQLSFRYPWILFKYFTQFTYSRLNN